MRSFLRISVVLLVLATGADVSSARCYVCSQAEAAICTNIPWWGSFELGYTNCRQDLECGPTGYCVETCRVFGIQCTYWDVIPF